MLVRRILRIIGVLLLLWGLGGAVLAAVNWIGAGDSTYAAETA